VQAGFSTAFCSMMFLISAVAAGADEIPPTHDRRTLHGAAFQANQAQVNEGSEAAAKEYYQKKLSPQIKFSTAEKIAETTITDLLAYFGYSNIEPKDLHRLGSAELMALSASGDILATRFFAPKITDVQDKPAAVPAFGFGWRKLVRFKAKAGSLAETNGMLSLYFLQNTLVPKASDDPYKDPARAVSLANQAIVVAKKPSATFQFKEDMLRAVYFLTYGPLVKIKEVEVDGVKRKLPDVSSGGLENDGKISVSLAATFDEYDRDPETNSNPKDYFVPAACEQCHGGKVEAIAGGKLNFLDTDHWFDRVFPSYGLADAKFSLEDFTAIASSPNSILYDAKTNKAGADFKAAFDVIYKLNGEIKAQNQAAGGSQFQLNAVSTWLDLHQSDPQRVLPVKRGFGVDLWQDTDEHKKMLYYLNRYCYRCHSSVVYNVFDRRAVRVRRPLIQSKVVEIDSASKWMPQDRIFPGLQLKDGSGQATGDLKEFLDLLSGLQ